MSCPDTIDIHNGIDELWRYISSRFHTVVLNNLPYHSAIVKELYTLLTNAESSNSTNILMYGAPEFPKSLLWECIFADKYGSFRKTRNVWRNQINYLETPYFFEVDVADPQHPKDIEILSNFIKDIVQHPCVLNRRHIIVVNNIDKICMRGSTYAFRVLLERFSSNALFVCTTTKLSSIEKPLLSRCIDMRIPLPSTEQLQSIFQDLNIPFHPFLIQNNCCDIYFAVFIAYMTMISPESVTNELCKYKIPKFYEFITKKNISIEDIRQFTSQISVHDVSISNILHDLLIHTKTLKKKHELIEYSAKIDYMCNLTHGYRKPLYIELLLNIALFGLNREDFKNKLQILSHNF